jgi:hypothetical protein
MTNVRSYKWLISHTKDYGYLSTCKRKWNANCLPVMRQTLDYAQAHPDLQQEHWPIPLSSALSHWTIIKTASFMQVLGQMNIILQEVDMLDSDHVICTDTMLVSYPFFSSIKHVSTAWSRSIAQYQQVQPFNGPQSPYYIVMLRHCLKAIAWKSLRKLFVENKLNLQLVWSLIERCCWALGAASKLTTRPGQWSGCFWKTKHVINLHPRSTSVTAFCRSGLKFKFLSFL